MQLEGNEGDLGWRILRSCREPAIWLGWRVRFVVPWVVAALLLLLDSVLLFPWVFIAVDGRMVVVAAVPVVDGRGSASEKCKRERFHFNYLFLAEYIAI